MNNVVLIGRLTREPDVRYGKDNSVVAHFTLAVDRYSKDDADFINCTAFNKTGELVENYCRKGMKIAVNGSIRTGSYENKEGNTVYTTEVIVNNVEFCEKKSDNTDEDKNNKPKNRRNR